MSSLIQEATIKIRQDESGDWTSANPTPLKGEFCLETDTEKIKIGDGETEWNTLDYIIGDNTITLAKMAGGTAGELITYDDSGDPAHVAVGTSGQVLTSNGAGSAPSMEDPMPIGTTYIQFPDKDNPNDLGFYGTWENISDEFAGDFFRAEGGNASAFEAGQQEDAFQGHWHYFRYKSAQATTFLNDTRVLCHTTGAGEDLATSGFDEQNTSIVANPLTDGTNGTPRTGLETRIKALVRGVDYIIVMIAQ